MDQNRADHLTELLSKALDSIPLDWMAIGETVAFFQQHGIVGKLGCPERCLVANYLTSVLPLADNEKVAVGSMNVVVDDYSVTYGDLRQPDALYNAQVKNPPGLSRFISAFDQGFFPQLIDRTNGHKL